MQSLESRLNPAKFFRVHCSAIVQLRLVDTLHKASGGDYEVQLKDGTRLRVSRSRREHLSHGSPTAGSNAGGAISGRR